MAIPLVQFRKSFRTYSFRITLLYVALFGVAVLILFAVIYGVTAEFMEAQLRTAIGTEMSSLVDDFGVAGIDGTVDAITQRVGSIVHDSSYSLLKYQACW